MWPLAGMDANLLVGMSCGAAALCACGARFPAYFGAATAAATAPKPRTHVRVAAMMPPGEAAKLVEKACQDTGAIWCGAEDELGKFSDDVLATVEVLAMGHGLSGKMLGENWARMKALKWFQTSSAGVEHIFRDNLCPQLPSSSVVMTNASGAYTQIVRCFPVVVT